MKLNHLVILLIGLILVSSCSNTSEDPQQPSISEEPSFTPLSESISFSQTALKLENPMAGIAAFNIEDTLYLLTFTDLATMYKLSANELSKILDGKDYGFIKRGSFNVEVVDDKAYIIGGAVDKKVTGCTAKVSTGAEYDCSTDEVWVFNPSDNSLTQTISMKNAREVLASGVVDKKIFVIGGWFPNSENNNEETVEVFENNEWNEVEYSGTYYPVRSAAYAAVDKKIYLFGGCLKTDEENQKTFSCDTQYTQIFDTETNTFSQGTKMPLAGRHFSGQHTAVRGKYIYVFGGAAALSSNIFDDIAVYDTETDTWLVLDEKLTIERKSTGATVLLDKLWIFGGITCEPKGKCPVDGGDKKATDSIEMGSFV